MCRLIAACRCKNCNRESIAFLPHEGHRNRARDQSWVLALGCIGHKNRALQMLQLLEPFGTSQKTTKTTQNHPDLRDLLGEGHAFEQMVADPGTWAWSPSEASRLPVEPSGATTGTCHASVGKLGTVPVIIQMQLEAVAMVHRTSLEVSEYHWVSVLFDIAWICLVFLTCGAWPSQNDTM